MLRCLLLCTMVTLVPPHLDAHGLEVLLVAELPHAARRGEQRLGGHAAAVDAGAADVVALNDRDLQALLMHRHANVSERTLPSSSE